jgi:two-component system, NarL family, sensor kinase
MLNTRLIYLFILLFFCLSPAIPAQNIDSLETVFRTKKLPVNEQLKLCDDISWEYLSVDAEKSKVWARKGIARAQKQNDHKMTGILYRNLGVSCYMISQMDSALNYFNMAESFARKVNDDELLDKINFARANLYNRTGDYKNAISIYLENLTKSEKKKDWATSRKILGNLGTLYFSLHKYDLSEKYYRQCAVLSEKAGDDWTLSQVYNGLANIYIETKQYEKALDFANKTVVVARRCGHKENEALAYQSISKLYYDHFKDFDKAVQAGLEGLNIARQSCAPGDVAAMLNNLSNIYSKKGDYTQCMNYALEAIKKDTLDLDVYGNMAANVVIAGIHLNEKGKALKYLDIYFNIDDRRSKDELMGQIAEMETKYQTEKKNIQIEALQRQRKLETIISVSGGIILLLFIVVISYRYAIVRRNKRIAEQKIIHLEQEKQLIASQALLAGEENERTRLASDLHDGLGGLLTGIKVKLFDMKQNAIITKENLKHFDNALGLLDTSIKEMKRVAYNLMPETLVVYGLGTAIRDFTGQFPSETGPVLIFNQVGDFLRYQREIEITSYRITQELVTNAVKHARAKEIVVQLFCEPMRICIQVTDDGIGFNPETQNTSSGNGLKNIRDRITVYNGRFEIVSEPGKGTESTLEFVLT